MTRKILFLNFLITSALFAIDIPTAHTKERAFSSSVELNAQIIQLSNASQSVTTQISGHLEKYYIQPGQRVKAGQKIALIESITVSKMTADFISLKKQYTALKKNYKATKKLYENGMTSMQELNNQTIQKDAMSAQVNALESQLKTLRIDTGKLTKASPNFTLYAHSAGKVSQLLLALHTVVKVDEALINIVKEQAFYVKSFLPLNHASKVKVGQKMVVEYNARKIITHVTQVLPSVDETTQRIVVLSSVDEKVDDLFVNSYVKSTLFFTEDKKYVSVEKSALSFFHNEWVVFMPKSNFNKEYEEKESKELEEKEKTEIEEDEEEEYISPYEARVIEIITQNDKYVAVKGLELNEEYVSAKSYYVKSMILKSSLGDGD